MTITPNLVIEPILLLVGVALYLAGFVTCAVLVVAKDADKPPPKSCETCKHSQNGELDIYNSNCAKCLTTYANAGYERRK